MSSTKAGGSGGPAHSRITQERRPTDSDEVAQLIAAVAVGDRAAFRSLYDRVCGRVMATTMRILRDRALAEDAAQEAFVKIWRHAKRFDPQRGSPQAWIGVIARNAALDRVTSARSVATGTGVEVNIDSYEAEPMDVNLVKCLNHLPEPRGQALVLMYVHGLTHRELAERLSAPLGTVKSWVRRGAMELRECLKE
jgi:RNA polymerase sigma-70 factor (ECF subfamily)